MNLSGTQRGGEASMDIDVTVLDVSAEAHATTVKAGTEYGDGVGTVSVEGPNAGVDIGIRSGLKKSGFSAMAEASVGKATGTLGPLYAEANLNANTGLKIGTEGVKANFLGLGFTLGVGGKFTFDTPFGSIGGCDPMTIKNEITNEQTVRHEPRPEVLLKNQ